MATATNELLELVLRECAAAHGQPWYPSTYVQATGLERQALDVALDQLRLAGLLRLTDWVQGRGQGYVLTELGAEVAHSPRLLEQLRRGPSAPISAPSRARADTSSESSDRFEAVRNALLDPHPPRVTFALLGLNIAVFLLGLALCQQRNIPVSAYLDWPGQVRGVEDIRRELGELRRANLDAPDSWWRLLGYAFVHGGAIHLLMNMYALFVLGPLIERMWGSWRYLILYLFSAVGGGLGGVLLQPGAGLVGASGAICGLLGSMFVWVGLNRRYLGSTISSEWMRNIVVNIVLLAVISMVPGVSWAGHLGGGVVGMVIAVPLLYQRFGSPVQRLLGLVGILLFPFALCGVALWQASDSSDLKQVVVRYAPLIAKTEQEADPICQEATKLLHRASHDRPIPAAEMVKFKTSAERVHQILANAEQQLTTAPEYSDPRIRVALKQAIEYFRALKDYIQRISESIDDQGKAELETWQRLEGRRNRITSLYTALFRDSVLARPLHHLLREPGAE